MRVAHHLVHRRSAKNAVSKAGRMRHQLAHRRRMVRLNENHLSVRIHAVVDLQVRELGNVFCIGSLGSHLPCS